MSYVNKKVVSILGSQDIIAAQAATGELQVITVPGPAPLNVDVIDRWARQLGLVDLSRVLGAPLAAANPVIAGIYNEDNIRANVFPHDRSIPTSPAKIVVEAFDTLVGKAAVNDAINLALSTDHRGSGIESVEWDKAGTNILSGVQCVLPAALDLSLYSTHAILGWFGYIPTPAGGNVTSIYVAIGTDIGNNFYWQIPAAEIVLDAWHHYDHQIQEIDGVFGVGANLGNVAWCAIVIVTDAAGCTFNNARVDSIIVKRSWPATVSGHEDILRQVTPADALDPVFPLTTTSFPHVYDAVAGDWNRWIQSVIEGVPLVQEAIPTSPIEGQITMTGAAQQCPADPCLAVTFENDINNAVVVIGHDNAVTLLNGYRLQPGATKSYAIDNVDRFWVIGTAPQIISYGGVNN